MDKMYIVGLLAGGGLGLYSLYSNRSYFNQVDYTSFYHNHQQNICNVSMFLGTMGVGYIAFSYPHLLHNHSKLLTYQG